jgi:uncharacterized membrane protein (DUF2068 family)
VRFVKLWIGRLHFFASAPSKFRATLVDDQVPDSIEPAGSRPESAFSRFYPYHVTCYESGVGLATAISAGESIESVSERTTKRGPHNRVLLLIAVYKGLQALFFVGLGIGALHLLHKDIDDVISNIGDLLRFNPESKFVNFLYDRASLINDPLLKRIGALAFSYAGLSLAEGIGLYLEKAWGEYLTLAITASFLPWEIFEVFHRLTWVRVTLLVANTLVFIYLLKIVTGRRKPVGASN